MAKGRITEKSVLVEERSSHTGITLNDILALVSHGHFVVNKILLQTVENTLTVALTTLTGKTVTANLAVTSLGNPAVLELQPSTTSGIAPLTVSFAYQHHTTGTISKIALDFNSDGSNDFITTNSEAVLQDNYTTPGLSVATLTVTDNQGTVLMVDNAVLESCLSVAIRESI